ncbi:MAG: hypothetical protein AAGJ83_14735, partial [Planctomycetota bacterium]
MNLIVLPLVLSLVSVVPCDAIADEATVISGTVVDMDGHPVREAEVSGSWRANGNPQRPGGENYDLDDPAQRSEFWGRIGEMASWQASAKTDADGRFSVTADGRPCFLILDSARQNGALLRMSQQQRRVGLRVKLLPLTTVRAKIKIKDSEELPLWAHAYVNVSKDPGAPLESTRIVSCGSETGHFEFRLPPGQYTLDTYAISGREPDNIDLGVFPNPEF